VSDLQDL